MVGAPTAKDNGKQGNPARSAHEPAANTPQTCGKARFCE